MWLILVSVILLIIEMFVPSFGILGVLGLMGFLAGIYEITGNSENVLTALIIAEVFLVGVIIILLYLSSKRDNIWKKMILRQTLDKEQGYSSNPSHERFIEKTGIAITTLRPAGAVDIEGERVDCVTDGSYIESGSSVKVIRVEGIRVVVEKLKKE